MLEVAVLVTLLAFAEPEQHLVVKKDLVRDFRALDQ